MRYIVKAGDTLSAIARAHGISLNDILDANPGLRENPDRINVGQEIELPDNAASSSADPAPAAQPGGWVLGALSTRYETGGHGPATVSSGVGDAGGVSYGSYQMTSANGGTVSRFVSQADFPWRDDFSGLTPGSAAFSAKWVEIANGSPTAFAAAEHEFIKRTHFDPLCQKIRNDDNVDVTRHPPAVQDVIWSTAVQHGPNTDVVHLAFNHMRAEGTFDPSAGGFDRNAIVAIYDERGRKDANGVLVHFSRNSQAVQDAVARRFVNEKADALRMLDSES